MQNVSLHIVGGAKRNVHARASVDSPRERERKVLPIPTSQSHVASRDQRNLIGHNHTSITQQCLLVGSGRGRHLG